MRERREERKKKVRERREERKKKVRERREERKKKVRGRKKEWKKESKKDIIKAPSVCDREREREIYR